jgi:hypothetical protein
VNHQYRRALSGEAVFERAEVRLHHTPTRRHTFPGCPQILSVAAIDPGGAQGRDGKQPAEHQFFLCSGFSHCFSLVWIRYFVPIVPIVPISFHALSPGYIG